jgi:hypothetical protein
MEPGNRRNLIAENLTPKNDKGHRPGVIEAERISCFIRGLKRTDKGNHYEGRIQKACYPSMIAPTKSHN